MSIDSRVATVNGIASEIEGPLQGVLVIDRNLNLLAVLAAGGGTSVVPNVPTNAASGVGVFVEVGFEASA